MVTLAVNASAPRASQALLPPLVLAKTGGKAMTSTAALPSTSTTALTGKFPMTAEQHATVATNNTTTGPGQTGASAKPILCGAGRKRSWTVRGRSNTHLHVRECLAPKALQPATALAPAPNTASEAENKPRPASSPEPQAPEVSQQADSQQPESEQPEPQEADSQQTDSYQASIQQANSPQTQSQQTDAPPAIAAPSVDFELGTPNVAPTPIDAPIIVQGQTVPANGQPITVNNQPVSLASGYIHVGTLSAPIPIAQVTPPIAQPIVAGTLTFQPASPSLVQVAPSPFVVGGFTFFAAQAEPSAASNEAIGEPEARPVVVGGKMYAPLQPTSEYETSQEAGKTAEQGVSEPETSQEQPDNLINKNHQVPDAASNLPGQADSKPIEIAGTTYTPVTTPATLATPSPPHPSIFSFRGETLTQGGSAITVSGTLISLGPSGVLFGTSSIPFSPTATPTTTTSLLPVNSQTLTALHVGSKGDEKWGFEIDHSTILPGSPGLSISGTLYSLNADGSLIIGTSTIALATAGSNYVLDNTLTAGEETFTPLDSTAVLVDGTPLSIGGPALTEHGTKISLASNGLVVGSSTFAYATPAVTNTAGLPSGVVSGSSSTGILPSVAATPVSAIPSITGSVSRSSASVDKVINGVMMAGFGLFASLCVI